MDGHDQTLDAGAARSATPAEPPALPGYEVIRAIGRGGMGVVFQARDLRLDRLVAIKTIAGELSGERLELLRREARLAAGLRHPNIVTIHALEEVEPRPCVVMEWVDGVYLDAAAALLDDRAKARLMAKVARAVAYAHSRNVLHRDLKPSNIVVDRTGEPRLLDFGLARAAQRDFHADAEDAQSGPRGTPLYMAPEQFTAPDQIGPATDVYALGLVLFELLTGEQPPRPADLRSFAAWAGRSLPLPRAVRPDLDEALQRICLVACERVAADRYASARHFAEDLERYADGKPVTARPRRYDRLLEQAAEAHVREIHEWQTNRLIPRRDADRLLDRYAGLIATDRLAGGRGAQISVGGVLVQAGGWLVVLSVLLWMWFYWHHLGPLERVVWVGLPTLLINGAAALLWSRPNRFIALVFSVLGVLLVPLAVTVLVSELGLLAGRMTDAAELLPPSLFSNRQLVVGAWLGVAFAAWQLRARQYLPLAAAFVVLLALAFAAALTLFGFVRWIREEQFATAAACWLVVPILALLAARRLDRPQTEQLAPPFYALYAIALLAALATLALDAPKTWAGLDSPANSDVADPLAVARELNVFTLGVACLALAWAHDRSATRLRRLWGGVFARLAAPLCTIPIDLLSQEPLYSLGRLGGAEVQAVELFVPVLCCAVIAVGVSIQLRLFMYYGLAHLAFFALRFTGRHLADYTHWPLAVLLLGAAFVAAGLWLERRLARPPRSAAAVGR